MSQFFHNLMHPNPLLKDWSSQEFGLPPFATAKPSDFEHALHESMEKQICELQAIANNSEAPTFANTIAAFDNSGSLFQQVSNMFDNLCSSDGVPELQAVELKMAGPLAAHQNRISSLPGLFERIDAVHTARFESGLDRLNPEQIRLVERFHLDFVRAGAKFSADDQAKYAKITEKLAELCTVFTQNLLADETDITVTLQATDLAGLPADLIAAARQAAVDRQMEADTYVITLSRSLVEPFITFSERRDLREKAWKLWTCRGELDASRNNLDIAKQILELRVQQAQMHGYENYAQYALADTMAGHPAKVMELLERVWQPAKLSIDRERNELEQFIRDHATSQIQAEESHPHIEAWDWRYYAEKVRQRTYNLDESELKPYFPLDRMVAAIFDCAHQLFGLSFKLRADLVSYHPDVQTYEVTETRDGVETLVAIFLHDNYARQNKKSGAWMSEYRVQSRHVDAHTGAPTHTVPIIVNNNNFNKPGPGETCLLSFDDARTLFHEFGHGLHGMLSNVTYKRLAGTSVLRDFVELPSQLYEHWLSEPSVLAKHARHYQTGEAIPAELLQRMFAANKFGQGFATIEYSACVLVDIALHQLTDLNGVDITAFEQQELGRLGMPSGMVMRHRPAHFAHLFAGSGYASAYYVYLWAEVLDADGFDAFLESPGGCFDPEVAARVRKFIYSAGNSRDPAEAYRLFRGRDPAIEPMLKKKGLLIE